MGKHLTGKVALITGSGQGVGRGIARYFARQGAIVITNNTKPKQAGKVPAILVGEEREKWLALRGDAVTVAEEIRKEGGMAEPYFCDVSDFHAVGRMVEEIVKKYGALDILVNNAAVTRAGALVDLSERDWDLETVVKMKGMFNCMRHAVPYMMEKKWGRILNIASDAWTGLGNMAAYSAANAGAVGLTKACSMELDRFNITCNAICPQAESPGHIAGFAEVLATLKEAVGQSEMRPQHKAEVDSDHQDAIGLAPFLAYLCSDYGKDISGAVFSVCASGKIGLYDDPKLISQIEHPNGIWTVEELAGTLPESLLKGYENFARVSKY